MKYGITLDAYERYPIGVETAEVRMEVKVDEPTEHEACKAALECCWKTGGLVRRIVEVTPLIKPRRKGQ